MPVLSPKAAFSRGSAVAAGLTFPVVVGTYAAGAGDDLLLVVLATLPGIVKVGAFCAAVAWVAGRRSQPPPAPAPLAACIRGAAVGAIVLGAGYAYWNSSDEPARLVLGVLTRGLAGGVAIGVLWGLAAWIMRPLGAASPPSPRRAVVNARTP